MNERGLQSMRSGLNACLCLKYKGDCLSGGQVVRKMLLKWKGKFVWERVAAPAADDPTLAGFAVKMNPSLLERHRDRLLMQFRSRLYFWDQFVADRPASYVDCTERAAASVPLRNKAFAALRRGPPRAEGLSLGTVDRWQGPEVTSWEIMYWRFSDPPIDKHFLCHAVLHDKHLYELLPEGLQQDWQVAIASMASHSMRSLVKIPREFLDDPDFWVEVVKVNGAAIKGLSERAVEAAGVRVLWASMQTYPRALYEWPWEKAPLKYHELRNVLGFARRQGLHPFNCVPHALVCGLDRQHHCPPEFSDESFFWDDLWTDVLSGDFDARVIVDVITPEDMTDRIDRARLRGSQTLQVGGVKPSYAVGLPSEAGVMVLTSVVCWHASKSDPAHEKAQWPVCLHQRGVHRALRWH